MQSNADDAIRALEGIRLEFAEFCARFGDVSESDTRVKLIDRILREVFDWPESEIRREEHSPAGFLDYSLHVNNRRFVVVEAKKEGTSFVLPTGALALDMPYKLSGAIATNRPLADAIAQARSYCSEEGIRYAIVTNGYAWVLFRALREDIPWREGSALVFPSIDYMVRNFSAVWNRVSYQAISSGSLDDAFGSPGRVSRRLTRVSQRLFNSDLPLERNRLHQQLGPIIDTFFADIADQAQLVILNSCYVHSGSLRIVADDLNCVIEDALPKLLELQGVETLEQGAEDSGEFGRAVEGAVATDRHLSPSQPMGRGRLLLLLGGIGAGKTTFLRRYQRTVGTRLLAERTFWFHIDFLRAPIDASQLEHAVWLQILDELRGRYEHLHLERRADLKRIFRDKVNASRQTSLREYRDQSPEFEAKLSQLLEEWRTNLVDYVPRLLRYQRMKSQLSITIFIDNVDQLSPDYQAKIFMLAQRITASVGAVTIMALREESYFSASVQRIFTAYTNQKFHIASPRFRRLIGSRIGYALRVLKDEGETARVVDTRLAMDRDAILDFLRIMETSIFEHNKQIARFIEATSFGNMRAALQMFATFLTSGATDVDKMLRIYRRDGGYFVAFHELVKSVMLGDRRYYKESESPILNVFDCGSEQNASHFTALRILGLLLAHRGESSPEGQGYVELANVVAAFEERFDDRSDCVRTLQRLLARQLIEADTRVTDSLAGVTHVRATSAGWYFDRYLVSRFAYLDLVLQDTPFDDDAVEATLRRSVELVDNLGDREEEKMQRIEARFARVDEFLGYLERQEREERALFGLDKIDSIVSKVVVSPLRERFVRERAEIRKRLASNRERYEEALVIDLPAEEDLVLGSDDDADWQNEDSVD